MTTQIDVPRARPTAEHATIPARPSPSGLRDGSGLRSSSASTEGRRSPLPADVGRIQAELGIRAERPPLEGYGPGSHFSESMLFAAYRRAGGEEA